MISPSVLRRRIRRRLLVVRLVIPQVSPYADRLRDAAVGDHVCQPLPVDAGETRDQG